MTDEQSAIREKRNIMRAIYGGMMTQASLAKELGMKPEDAKEWARERGIGGVYGARIKFETDMVAKAIVQCRGFC